MQLPQGLALWKPISDRHFSPSLFYAPFYALLLLCSLSSSQKCLRQAGACCLVPIWLVWTFNFRAHADPAVEDPTGSETNHGFLYFCMALITLDRLVWSDLESFQRVTKEVKDGKAVLEPVPRPWSWKRFKWSLSLIFSFRGVGWNWQVKNTPAPQPKRTRLGLLIETVFMMFVRIFVADLAATFLRLYLPQPLALTHVKSLPWDKQLVLTTVSITLKVINNPFIRDLVFLPSLLLSDRPADEYRPYWGGVASLQSLGTAWGVTWHQGLRRITTRPAYLLLDKIGVPRGTFIYFALHVFICFTLSGLGHMWTILSGGNSGWPTLAFFWLQACGILFEATLYLLSPWSCPVWIKRVWAVAFVAYTAPLFLEDIWKIGHWSQPNPEANVLLPLYSFVKGRAVDNIEMLQDLRQWLNLASA